MKVFSVLKKIFKRRPIIHFTNVPFARGNRLEWYAKADISDYNLQFNTKREADAYRALLKNSRSSIGSRTERVEYDRDTNIIVTYPPKENNRG